MTPKGPGRPPRLDYISLSEAADMIGVSSKTVERMMDDGRLGFRRTPGGYRRLHRTDVEDYCRLHVDIVDDTR